MSNCSIKADFIFNPIEQINSTFELNEPSQINADFLLTLGNATYIHEQAAASAVWVITHNLGKYPSVTLVDSAGTQFYAEVEYNSINQCTIYMNSAFKGRAYLN